MKIPLASELSRFRRDTLAKAIATCLAATLLAGCLHDDDDDDDPVSSSTSAASEITTTKVDAAEVVGSILVPKSEVSKFVADIDQQSWYHNALFALRDLIPAAIAIDAENDFAAVNAQDIRLFRFNSDTGVYDEITVTTEQQADFDAAVVAGSDGTYSIDLEALVDAGILPAAELDTSLQIRVTLQLAAGGTVELSAPLVDAALDVTPLTELLIRRLANAGTGGLDNLSISEARKLIQAANDVVVSDAGNKTIEELITDVEEVAGSSIDQQFEEYQAPEPEASDINAADGEYAFMVFGEGLIGTHSGAVDQFNNPLNFGEYFDFLERLTIDVDLNSQGNGSITFRGGSPLQRESEMIQSHDGSSVTNFFTESDTEGDSGSLPAELNGNGTLIVTDEPFAEFDNQFFQWEVFGGGAIAFRPLDFGGAKPGRLGVIRSLYDNFDDVAGPEGGTEENHTSPDFDSPRFRSTDSVLAIGLPASTVAASDFDQDLGVITLDISRTNQGSTTYVVGNERLTVDSANPGMFSGGTHEEFGITRQLGIGADGTFFNGSEVNTDTLTFTGGTRGRLSVASSESSGTSTQGIAAPGGDFGAVGFEFVACFDGSTTTEHEDTLVCPEGANPTEAGLGLGLFVPLSSDTGLTAGDQYSYNSYEFFSDTSPTNGVSGCRGKFTIGSTGLTLEFAAEEACASVERPVSSETDIPFITTFNNTDGGTVPVTVSAGAIIGDPASDPEVRGYISANGEIILLRYADPNDPHFVGIAIAQRQSSAQ